jgi:hypothetical protein
MFRKIIIILILIMNGCDSSLKSNLGADLIKLTFPNQYEIKDSFEDWGIGESSRNYTLIISKDDYNKIVDEIRNKPKFKSKIKYNYSTRWKYSEIKTIKEEVFEYNKKYFYKIYNPDPGIMITVIMKQDSLMNIIYEDL